MMLVPHSVHTILKGVPGEGRQLGSSYFSKSTQGIELFLWQARSWAVRNALELGREGGSPDPGSGQFLKRSGDGGKLPEREKPLQALRKPGKAGRNTTCRPEQACYATVWRHREPDWPGSVNLAYEHAQSEQQKFWVFF